MNVKAIGVFLIVSIVAFLIIAVAAAAYLATSTVNVPAGTVKSDTFVYSATLNKVAVANPAIINVTRGFVGDVSTIVYTVKSTANQPITVNAVANAGTLDKFLVDLASNGSTGTFTLNVTLTASPQTITISFSSTA
jgi:hypothetical protein